MTPSVNRERPLDSMWLLVLTFENRILGTLDLDRISDGGREKMAQNVKTGPLSLPIRSLRLSVSLGQKVSRSCGQPVIVTKLAVATANTGSRTTNIVTHRPRYTRRPQLLCRLFSGERCEGGTVSY